eukprot:TRINITY_DN4078_c1_g1_i1.p1 TRINITY_DN4078_c1_g1~~TRINITY_DN4078_c1_g1_i1.p1  ORF type:complete len:488 (+),score=80.68 TRINITY_DN4078_c1_g1_i1:155-1465(+)
MGTGAPQLPSTRSRLLHPGASSFAPSGDRSSGSGSYGASGRSSPAAAAPDQYLPAFGRADDRSGRSSRSDAKAASLSPSPASERAPLLPGSKQAKAQTSAVRQSQALRFNFVLCAAVFWYAVGVIYFMQVEGFGLCFSTYFIVQIATTVGYGDMPEYRFNGTPLFVAVYSLVCILIVAFAVSQNLGKAVLRASQRAMVSTLRKDHAGSGGSAGAAVASIGTEESEDGERYWDMVVSGVITAFVACLGTIFYATYEGCSCFRDRVAIDGCMLHNCRNTGGEIMSWSSSLYMAVITMLTIGFGDAHPNTQRGVEVGTVFMIVGVASISNFIRAFTLYFMANAFKKQLTLDQKIDRQLFDEMDVEGKGVLSRDMFMRYMLRRCQIVGQDVLDAIDAQFDALDPTGQTCVTYESVEMRYREQAPSPFEPWRAFLDRALVG